MPLTLADPSSDAVRELVIAARQRRLVLYLGAGVSIPAPSCGPTGNLVADRLRSDVAQIVGCDATDLVGLKLEELAQRVQDESPEQLDELRRAAAGAFDFTGIAHNAAHEGIALLLREGLVEVASVNWDCGVEQAGIREANVRIEGVARAQDRLQLTHGQLPLYKVHGCARKPETLALTRAEVDQPQTWAVALVQNALTAGPVVFVGLGTVGLYVTEPINELLKVWQADDASVLVVDPVLSDAWREVLADPDASHIDMGAIEFVDDLMRAVVKQAIAEAKRSMRPLVENEVWAAPMEAGFDSVSTGLDDVHGDAVLRWWRDGVIDTAAGKPFITELSGQKALMTVALVAGSDGGLVAAQGVRGRLSVGTADRYLEIVSRPGAHFNEVEPIARDRVLRRRQEAVYPESKPVTVIVVDAFGIFPARHAPVDIAAGDERDTEGDLLDGISATVIEFVSAEDAVRGLVA
jgi:SIR2-like domain